MNELLNMKEAAALVHIPVGTLSYYRYAGIGPANFKLGRRVMYRRESLLAWVAEQEVSDSRTPRTA